MNRDEALAFLREHQPMPPDRDLTQETIDRYEEVRCFFVENPDPACIRPLLHSFGEGDGFGVYQLVGEAFQQLPEQEVIEGIAEALINRHRSVRYWSAHLAVEFSSPKLTSRLLSLLKEDDNEAKYFALCAIEYSADTSAVPELERFVGTGPDDELRVLAEEVIAKLRSPEK